jgi:hypothetical protein
VQGFFGNDGFAVPVCDDDTADTGEEEDAYIGDGMVEGDAVPPARVIDKFEDFNGTIGFLAMDIDVLNPYLFPILDALKHRVDGFEGAVFEFIDFVFDLVRYSEIVLRDVLGDSFEKILRNYGDVVEIPRDASGENIEKESLLVREFEVPVAPGVFIASSFREVINRSIEPIPEVFDVPLRLAGGNLESPRDLVRSDAAVSADAPVYEKNPFGLAHGPSPVPKHRRRIPHIVGHMMS